MGRGFGITAAVSHDVVRGLAPAVEGLGYRSVWVNAMPKAGGLASLAVTADGTSEIDLGVGVVPLDRRPAATIVEQASGLPSERLIVGVGSGTTKRALDLVRAGVGELRASMDTRVVVGALGPKMAVLGGEVAHGVLFNWMTPA